MAFDLAKNSKIGAGVGILGWLLGLLYNLIFSGGGQAQATIDIGLITQGVKASIQNGISTDLASKMIGWLNGLLPLDIMGLITLALAGAVIVNVGSFIFNMLPVPALKKTSVRRLTSITVIGTIVVGWIVTYMAGDSFALPTFNAVASMVIYFLIVSIVYGFAAKAKILKGVIEEV